MPSQEDTILRQAVLQRPIHIQDVQLDLEVRLQFHRRASRVHVLVLGGALRSAVDRELNREGWVDLEGQGGWVSWGELAISRLRGFERLC